MTATEALDADQSRTRNDTDIMPTRGVARIATSPPRTISSVACGRNCPDRLRIWPVTTPSEAPQSDGQDEAEERRQGEHGVERDDGRPVDGLVLVHGHIGPDRQFFERQPALLPRLRQAEPVEKIGRAHV